MYLQRNVNLILKLAVFLGSCYASYFIYFFHKEIFKHSLSQNLNKQICGLPFVLSLFMYPSHILSQECVVSPSFSLIFPTLSPSVTLLGWGIFFPITLRLTQFLECKFTSVSSEVICISYLTIPPKVCCFPGSSESYPCLSCINVVPVKNWDSIIGMVKKCLSTQKKQILN